MSNVDEQALSAKLPISPQVGEMPSFGKEGRTEGGASLRCQRFCTVVTLRSHGMDARVCAASLRSLLRPGMTKGGTTVTVRFFPCLPGCGGV
ncbi:MAG: hypothetical protein E5X67_25435 [Mesorhizobium sp.]|nr:MAG: hypothetical protein E5X67_25435 [Mesorhizobium sp.]